jgi:hypothetical protein
MMSDGLARAVLDALPDATAVLDPAGTITAVNQAWLMFALDNAGQPESTGVGVNYFGLRSWPGTPCTASWSTLAPLRPSTGGSCCASHRSAVTSTGQ